MVRVIKEVFDVVRHERMNVCVCVFGGVCRRPCQAPWDRLEATPGGGRGAWQAEGRWKICLALPVPILAPLPSVAVCDCPGRD